LPKSVVTQADSLSTANYRQPLRSLKSGHIRPINADHDAFALLTTAAPTPYACVRLPGGRPGGRPVGTHGRGDTTTPAITPRGFWAFGSPSSHARHEASAGQCAQSWRAWARRASCGACGSNTSGRPRHSAPSGRGVQDNSLATSRGREPVSLVQSQYRALALPQVIPEGAGPVKAHLCGVLVGSASFLVLAGHAEVGVGVKARAEPDRVAAGGP